ncbi:phenylalanine--tRNA ligase subunit beta [Bacillaceae bacterium S4-13-56]
MFVSLNWLKRYVDIGNIQPEELAERITKTGIEVESVERIAGHIDHLVVGHVVSCEQHPNADKLKLCKVDVGEETLQIICGAPNVAQGQKVAVAKAGAKLPGGLKIKKAKLRGEESNGMICSMQELGVDAKYVPEKYKEGIFVFPKDTEVGADASDLLNLDDVIIELGLTPNRADAMSMLGVAYEVAAILDTDVKIPEITYQETTEKASDYIDVEVADREANPYYGAFIIKNVKIGESPLWIRNSLIAAGIRPINNVVDITNYVLLEYGQPLHAFDYDRFGSKKVLVRRANEQEKIVTLDDETRTLSKDHLVITNSEVPVAIAGVMGGADSEVQEDTTTVLLEAALFRPQVIRQGSKDHQLRSEASSRYEKGIDKARVRKAGERACQLMQQYAGGEVLQGVVEVNEIQLDEKKVEVSLPKVNMVLGTDLEVRDVEDILRRLQFNYENQDGLFSVTVPTRRWDIDIFEDMVEEIARLYGYDNLPFTLPQGASKGALTTRQNLKRNIRRYMEGKGLNEAITYSLTTEERSHKLVSLEISSKVEGPVGLAMPMSGEHSHLRLSILPELLASVQHNQARQIQDVALYEVGSIYVSGKKKVTAQPEENIRLAGVLTGFWVNHPVQQVRQPVDFYVAKGILEGLFDQLGTLNEIEFKAGEVGGMHPGQTALITLSGETIGFVGQLHPSEGKLYDLKNTFVFDVNLDKVIEQSQVELNYRPIPRHPAVSRDIALVVHEAVPAGKLIQTIREAGGELLVDTHVFDVYQGENVEAGSKSVAISITYQNPTQTLTEEEINTIHEKVLKAVSEKHQAVLRG